MSLLTSSLISTHPPFFLAPAASRMDSTPSTTISAAGPPSTKTRGGGGEGGGGGGGGGGAAVTTTCCFANVGTASLSCCCCCCCCCCCWIGGTSTASDVLHSVRLPTSVWLALAEQLTLWPRPPPPRPRLAKAWPRALTSPAGSEATARSVSGNSSVLTASPSTSHQTDRERVRGSRTCI